MGMGEGALLKRLFYTIVVLICLGVLAVWGAVWYVKPRQTLDLSYEEISVGAIMLDMLKTRKFEVQLTERDVDHLIKKKLAQNNKLPHDIMITGAKFELRGNQLAADVNLVWDYKVHAGTKLFFTLDWADPDIVAVHTRTSIRDLDIPAGWFQLESIRIPLDEGLPNIAAVKSVAFDDKLIRIGLKLK